MGDVMLAFTAELQTTTDLADTRAIVEKYIPMLSSAETIEFVNELITSIFMSLDDDTANAIIRDAIIEIDERREG